MNKSFLVVVCCVVSSTFFTGCVTDGGTMFGNGKRISAKQERQNLEKVEQYNREVRLNDVEASLRLMRDDINSIIVAQNELNARINALSIAFEKDANSRSAESVAFSKELNALSAKQKTLESNVEALPEKFSKLLKTNQDNIMADVEKKLARSSRSSASVSSSYSGQCYEHVVESGQTLSEIAQAYGVKVSEIMSINGIKDPARLRVNQKILVPKYN